MKFKPATVSKEMQQALLCKTSPCYISYTLLETITLSGKNFDFAVFQIKLTSKNQLQQIGRDVVFCQTEEEANESGELLTAAAKEDMGIIRTGNIGGVGFVKKTRFIITEHAAGKMTLPNGKKVWMAREAEIDRATGEVTVKRKQQAANESEAERIAKQWLAEYNAEKQKHFAAIEKSKIPLPRPSDRHEKLMKTDLEDAAKAQMEVLRRQWKHCFALFDQRKDGGHFSEDDCRKAYLLDLAENKLNPIADKNILPAIADDAFWRALIQASNRAAKAKKKHIMLAVDYLLAFHYPLGWCYLSQKERAEKINALMPGHNFTPHQIDERQRRLNLGAGAAPGLVAKHPSGPPSNLPK
jgi:hypothetical protein